MPKKPIILALTTALLLSTSGCHAAPVLTEPLPAADAISDCHTTPPSETASATLPTAEPAPTQTDTLPPPAPTEPAQATTETITPSETLPSEPPPAETEPAQATETTSPTVHLHHLARTLVLPTCTDPGYTIYTCTCDESYTDDYTPATGHHYAEDSIPATLWSQGYTIYTCTVCNDQYQDNYISISESEQAAFIQAVQDATLRYISQFRETPAQSLPVLTQVANYRAVQLQENFAHSTTDMRAALAHFQYGKYITPDGWDPSQYYYSIPGKEAISRSSFIGTADEIGKHLAQNFYNSSGHWSYVGSSSYPYIAVGIAYDASKAYRWTCCVFVIETSEYE